MVCSHSGYFGGAGEEFYACTVEKKLSWVQLSIKVSIKPRSIRDKAGELAQPSKKQVYCVDLALRPSLALGPLHFTECISLSINLCDAASPVCLAQFFVPDAKNLDLRLSGDPVPMHCLQYYSVKSSSCRGLLVKSIPVTL